MITSGPGAQRVIHRFQIQFHQRKCTYECAAGCGRAMRCARPVKRDARYDATQRDVSSQENGEPHVRGAKRSGDSMVTLLAPSFDSKLHFALRDRTPTGSPLHNCALPCEPLTPHLRVVRISLQRRKCVTRNASDYHTYVHIHRTRIRSHTHTHSHTYPPVAMGHERRSHSLCTRTQIQ